MFCFDVCSEYKKKRIVLIHSAEREKFEREQRAVTRAVEIEGLRQASAIRNKDEKQAAVLQNNRIQFEVAAQLRFVYPSFDPM